MIPKSKNKIVRKPVSFLQPGQLAKDRDCAKKPSTVANGSKRVGAIDQRANNLCNHGRMGVNGVHNLFVHYGEEKWEEKNFTEESCFMDVQTICQRFIDIYTFGIRITDGNCKQVGNDKDLLGFLKEHENIEDISLFLYKDSTVRPLQFKLPHDNTSFASASNEPQMRDVITKDASTSNDSHMRDVITKDASASNDPQMRDVITKDGNHGEKSVEAEKTKKVRGQNKNKKICSLKKGEKLPITFYNNRAVGPNHTYWSRHLGKIVRDKQRCPVRVYTWKDVTESEKQLMWAMVTEYFFNPEMELYREHTLEHMGILWTSWRSSLNKEYVKPYKNKRLALKNVPQGFNANDWEWLVTNKFLSDMFQKMSSQNSDNRSNGLMNHRTGSKPHREVIYDMDEIIKTVQANASLSPIEVVETCFGPQKHSNVFGFGGGMKRIFFKDPQASQIKELKAKLQKKDEESDDLKRRVIEIESLLIEMRKEEHPTSNEPPTCGVE